DNRLSRPHRCACVGGGAHGQLPGGEGAHGQGKLRKGSRAGQQRKEGRQEVRGEEGETKEVTLATAFFEPGDRRTIPARDPFPTLAFLFPTSFPLLFRHLQAESFCVELSYFSKIA